MHNFWDIIDFQNKFLKCWVGIFAKVNDSIRLKIENGGILNSEL